MTMTTAEKLSLSLPKEQVRWAKRMARAQNTTFSGLISRLIEEKRQHEEALRAFDEYFGAKGKVTAKEAERLRRQWHED
jgi:intergrase/recombinase